MNNTLIYILVYAIGMLTTLIQTVIMFSRMQYMQYRFRKVVGLSPCGGDYYCVNTSQSEKFLNMTDSDKANWVNSSSAYSAMAMSLVSGIIGLFTIMPLGFLSDRLGRKIALGIAFLGFSIEVIMNGLTMALDGPVYIMIAATVPSSICGNGVIGILTQLYVCITDLTEVTAKVQERRLSIAPSAYSDRTTQRRESFLDAGEPKNLASVQSAMISKRLSLIAAFEGLLSVVMATGMMATGPILTKYGHHLTGWLIIILISIQGILTIIMPNTKALWEGNVDDRISSKSKKTIEVEQDSKKILLAVCPDGDLRNLSTPEKSPKTKNSCSKLFDFASVPVVIFTIVILLGSLVAMTDIPVLTLYLSAEPFNLPIFYVGLGLGLRGFGCALMNAAFVCFNLCYLQQKLAAVNQDASDLQTVLNAQMSNGELSDEEAIRTLRKAKVIKVRRTMLLILLFVLASCTVNRFLYGISSLSARPTCHIIFIIGMVLNSVQFFGSLIRVLMSSYCAADAQARLYALLGFGEAIGVFIGLTAVPAFYASTLSVSPGLVFVCAAFVLLIALILSCVNTYLLLKGKYK